MKKQMSRMQGGRNKMNDFKPTKYHSRANEIDGIKFASKREAVWYERFKEKKAHGEIKDFKMQVPFELIPVQKQIVTVIDKKGRQVDKEKVIERAVTYVADFIVIHSDGSTEVYDVKGFPDQKYPIKRKLLLYVHGLRITEVK